MAVSDVVEVGHAALAAEVVSVRSGTVTAQVYEYTGGLRVGDPAAGKGPSAVGPPGSGPARRDLRRFAPPTGRAACVARPPGSLEQETNTLWRFVAGVSPGLAVGPGTVLGRIPTSSGLEHRVLVPPWVSRTGRVDRRGEETSPRPRRSHVGEREPPVSERWPVRSARPIGRRRGLSPALMTGQRVVDLCSLSRKAPRRRFPEGSGPVRPFFQADSEVVEADVIVFVGCGERGNELADALPISPTWKTRRQVAAFSTHRGDRQHVQHAGDGARGEPLHRHDRRRVLS